VLRKHLLPLLRKLLRMKTTMTVIAAKIQLALGSSPRLNWRTLRMKLRQLKIPTQNLKNSPPQKRLGKMLKPSPRFLKPHQAPELSTPGSPQRRGSWRAPPVPHPPRSQSSIQLHASPQLPQLEGRASSLLTPLLAESLTPLLVESLLITPLLAESLLTPLLAESLLTPLLAESLPLLPEPQTVTRQCLMPMDPPDPPQLNPGEDTALAPLL